MRPRVRSAPTTLARSSWVGRHGPKPARTSVSTSHRPTATARSSLSRTALTSTGRRSKQLGFGIWTHFCIGAPLARMEAQIGLEQLLTRIPDIRLAPTQGPLEYTNNMVIPDLQALHVEWS